MHATRLAPGAWPGDDACASLLEDWVTIWQSELAAMVLDRELQEMQLAMLDALAAQMRGRLRNGLLASPGRADADADADANADDGGRAAAAGCAGPVPAPGPAAVVAAPDARDAELERLAARVAELEGKLAGA